MKNEPKHFLKTGIEYYDAMYMGDMMFNTRNNGREFLPGDIVCFVEVEEDGRETGESFIARIKHVLREWQLPGYVTFGFEEI